MNVPVVVLDDVAHRPGSREVLVDALGTDVMQRLRRLGIPVGPREVNSHLQKTFRVPADMQSLLMRHGYK